MPSVSLWCIFSTWGTFLPGSTHSLVQYEPKECTELHELLSLHCSPTDPLCSSSTPAPIVHSFNRFRRGAFFDVLLGSRTKGSYTLQVARQWGPHKGIYLQWCRMPLNYYLLCSKASTAFWWMVCMNQGIQQNKWDNNRCFELGWYGPNFCYENTLFRKGWTTSTVTHLHSPPTFFQSADYQYACSNIRYSWSVISQALCSMAKLG